MAGKGTPYCPHCLGSHSPSNPCPPPPKQPKPEPEEDPMPWLDPKE